MTEKTKKDEDVDNEEKMQEEQDLQDDIIQRNPR